MMPVPVGSEQKQELLLAETLDSLRSANKKMTWIRGDLSTSKSSVIGRAFWVIAKHFDWMRKLFYSVDLEESKKILISLKPQVQKNPTMSALFKAAVDNFNQIAPNHRVIFGNNPRVEEAAATEANTVSVSFSRMLGNIKVTVKEGNITTESVEAVVNAANSLLLGGAGVDGAIHKAGGPTILAQCRAIRKEDEYKDGLDVGEAVVTGSGNMIQHGIKYIVHTVGPRGETINRKALLHNAYYNSLVAAEQQGAKTVAFPSISTGIFGYPLEEATVVAMGAIREFTESHSGIEEVRFVIWDPTPAKIVKNMSTYKNALEKV